MGNVLRQQGGAEACKIERSTPEHTRNTQVIVGFAVLVPKATCGGKSETPSDSWRITIPPCRRQDAKNMAGTDGHMGDSRRIRDHRRLLVWRGLFFLVLQSSFEGFLRLPLQAFVTNKA